MVAKKVMLNNKQIDGFKPAGKGYKMADFDGLYLFVSKTGTKTWRFNFKHQGKQQTKTYGRYPLLGVSDARKLHHDFKYKIGDQAQASITFEQAARKWMLVHLPKLKNIKHKLQIAATLEQFIYPAFGKKPISDITRKELVWAVQAIDERGITETAHRVAGRVKQVFDYGVDLGEINVNPAIGLTKVLRKPQRTHMSSLPFNEVGDLIKQINSYDELITKIGLLLLAHTFVRTRELTHAKWSEFDLKNNVWVIPQERLKLGKPHVVPLSSYVKELINELHTITGNKVYAFESPKRAGHPISENTLLFTLYRLGYRGKMTGHGFRAIASSALNESGLWNPSAIERQLAHKETDAVRAAYHRAEYFEERVKMMEWWSKTLCALT